MNNKYLESWMNYYSSRKDQNKMKERSEDDSFPLCMATSGEEKHATVGTIGSTPRPAAPIPGITTTTKTETTAEEQRKTCDKYILSGLNRNMTVQFLIDRLLSMGCSPPKGFIQCIDCGTTMAGGGFGVIEEQVTSSNENNTKKSPPPCDQDYIKDKIRAQNEGKVNLRLLPEIFLCQNHLVNQEHAHQSMVHELIHAIDLCRTKMDPINNCIHMACTEIRAENLSGECNWLRELGGRKISTFRGHGAECVKRRAILSVKANPNCRDKASDYVDAAFDRCFQDTFPFDRHPNLR